MSGKKNASRDTPKLTEKQKKFITCYAGNGAQAAREAGYAGNDQTLRAVAYENLTKPHISQAIKARLDVEIEPLVADRIHRQKFWTKVMNSSKVSLRDRLRASELLAKSEADFKEAVRVEQIMIHKTEVDSEQIRALIKKLKEEY